MEVDYHKIDIGGMEAALPIIPIAGDVKIAFFNLHGDQVMTEHCGMLIADRLRNGETEVILTAESKGIELAHCVARNLGHRYYAVARKSKKLYIQDDAIEVDIDSSLTTGAAQKFFLSRADAKILKGKKVAIVDDVVSTGHSLDGLVRLVELAGGSVCKKIFCLAEGTAIEMPNIEYLSYIPVFNR